MSQCNCFMDMFSLHSHNPKKREMPVPQLWFHKLLVISVSEKEPHETLSDY